MRGITRHKALSIRSRRCHRPLIEDDELVRRASSFSSAMGYSLGVAEAAGLFAALVHAY